MSTKYLGNFCKKFFHQEVLKIAQLGHTVFWGHQCSWSLILDSSMYLGLHMQSLPKLQRKVTRPKVSFKP